ncbi:MAG: TonB-dependent receptor [Acidobacteria bacterium]|nr:TonB-dependent receptor [Acidobacteriota bacterium]
MNSRPVSVRSVRLRAAVVGLLLAAASLVITINASAQTYQGALRGAVRDAQGVIPGAEITLISEETNAERAAMTNEVGEYAFASVLPGTYTLRVSLPGFRTEERKGIRVGTQQSLVLDFMLEVGAISEQITVTGEAPLVERASASQAASLDQEALQSLPIFGRNTFFAAISTPGVIQTGDPQFVRYQDQSGSSQLSLGGGPRRGNGYLIEGVSITDLTNRPTIAPSMEAVEELKVQTKTYEADMGHAAGGVFNTTARSGSNIWHGSALLVSKPGMTTGTLFFAKRAGLENPPQYYHNWAGSLGGPLVKDKTFFWFSTDGYKQRSTRNSVLTLPTAAERAGNFSQTRNTAGQLVTIYDPLTTRTENGVIVRDPFPGNVIPGDRISAVARAMLTPMPIPTDGKSFNGQAILDDGPQDQETLKVDQRWTESWTMSGLYAHQHTKEPGSAFFGAHGTVPGDPSASLLFRTVNLLALNNIFIPDANTAVAVRYGINRFQDFGGNYPTFDAGTLGFPASLVSAMTFNTFPQAAITGYGGTTTLGNGGPSRTTHLTQTANASVSRLMGSHTLKFGAEYRRIGASTRTFSTSAGTYNFTQAFTAATPTAAGGDAFASFLLGFPSTGSIVYATPADYLVDYYAGYAQDEYRASSKLTLNYGLRYEYEPGVREADGHFTVGFDRDAMFPVQVPGMTLKGGLMYAGVNGYPTTQGESLNGLAPRGGFAWSVSDNDVIRGGYGFFWAPVQFSGVGETAMGRLGYTATTTYLSSTDGNRTPANSLSNPFPAGIIPPQGDALGLATGAGGVIDFVDQHSGPGQVHQYSIDYSHEFPAGIAVSIGYSGSRSDHMPVGGTVDATVNINQLDPQYLALGSALLDLLPNPFFGNSAFGNLANSATITRGQLLRPFPQFTDVLAHRVTDARARYNAMTLRFDKRVRDNWGVNANYTFSRLMDNQFGESNTYSARSQNALDTYDLDREWGYSLLDVPHRFNVNGTFVVPVGNGHRWLSDGIGSVLLGGWSVTMAARFQTGFPVSVWQSASNSGLLGGSSQGSSQRPNIVPGVDLGTSGSLEERLTSWINPAAFTAAPAYTLGNAPRTLSDLRTPGQRNVDLSVQKAQRISGGQTISVRADVLNLFDNPLFTTLQSQFGTPTFGQLTAVGGYARSVQFQVRFGF